MLDTAGDGAADCFSDSGVRVFLLFAEEEDLSIICGGFGGVIVI